MSFAINNRFRASCVQTHAHHRSPCPAPRAPRRACRNLRSNLRRLRRLPRLRRLRGLEILAIGYQRRGACGFRSASVNSAASVLKTAGPARGCVMEQSC